MTEQLAGRFKRLLATGIDAVLVPGLTIFFIMVTEVAHDAEDFLDQWWILHVIMLAVFSYLLLNGYLLWHHGQTIGKRLLGIAIHSANVDGGSGSTTAPFWKLVCIRALFFPLLFIGIVPFFTALPFFDQVFIFGKRRRCLHDYLSGTIVVRYSQKS